MSTVTTDLVRGVPANAPPLDIEWDINPQAYAALAAHIRANWTRLGQERPHHSAREFLPDAIETQSAAFVASGAADLEALLATLRRCGVDSARLPRLLEYGCGVGRCTPHFATRFARVTACDISPAHLDIARNQARAAHIDFRLIDSNDWGMTEAFDVWFSRIVLQHNPPPLIAGILRRAFALLAPGGVAVFQVPTYCVGYRFNLADYLANPPPTGTVEMHILPQPAVLRLADEAGCEILEVWPDYSAGGIGTWVSSQFTIRKRR